MAAPPRIALLALGTLWTSPNTLLGLLAGSIGWLAGGRAPVLGHGALVFHRHPWGPGGALTLGQVILCTGDTLTVSCLTYAAQAGENGGCAAAVDLGRHERAHVLQYLVCGPMFLPLYFLCGGISVRNRFERAADRYAASGQGWWPWPG